MICKPNNMKNSLKCTRNCTIWKPTRKKKLTQGNFSIFFQVHFLPFIFLLNLFLYITVIENFLLPKEYKQIVERFYQEIHEIRVEIVNTQDSEGYTPLHLASFYGDFTLVKYLIRLGADPQKKETKSKKEVLYFASNEETRKSLIDLKDAARKGDINSLNLLINGGNSIDSKKTIFGIAPIHNVFHFC